MFFLPLQLTGQPVLIGGTMGTCSYVLTGTEQGMTETFGTTCHGAVSHVIRSAAVVVIVLTSLTCVCERCRVELYPEPNPDATWTSRTFWINWQTWASPSEWRHQSW